MSDWWRIAIAAIAAAVTVWVSIWLGSGWLAAPIAAAVGVVLAMSVTIFKLAPYLVVADFIPIADYSKVWLQQTATAFGILEIVIDGYVKNGSLLVNNASLDKCLLVIQTAGGKQLTFEAGVEQFPERFGRQPSNRIVFSCGIQRETDDPDLECATGELTVKAVGQIGSSRYRIRRFRLTQGQVRVREYGTA